METLPREIAVGILRDAGHDARAACFLVNRCFRDLAMSAEAWPSVHIRAPDEHALRFVRRLHCLKHLIIGPTTAENAMWMLPVQNVQNVDTLEIRVRGDVPSNMFASLPPSLRTLEAHFDGGITRQTLDIPRLPNLVKMHLLQGAPVTLSYHVDRGPLPFLEDVCIHARRWSVLRDPSPRLSRLVLRSDVEQLRAPDLSATARLEHVELDVISQLQLRLLRRKLVAPLAIDTLVLRCHFDAVIALPLPQVKHMHLHVCWPGSAVDVIFAALQTCTALQTFTVTADPGLPTVRFLGVGAVSWMHFFSSRTLCVDSGVRVEIDPLD